jgi:hypothetical protein
MSTYEQVINSTVIGKGPIESIGNEQPEAQPVQETKSNKETNITDPKVCHDPIFKSEGIARLYTSENKTMMDNGESSDYNFYDALLTDGVQYPLLVINNKNIEDYYIMDYKLSYKEFLPTLSVIIRDDHQHEQKINSTQMSGLMRTCIVSSVDKVYKKIIMQFRITSVEIDHNNPIYVKYHGTYEIPNFRHTNIGHIWMKDFCPAKWCQHKGLKNANTWEFLHELAAKSGLGFAATYHTKDIEDRSLRNIPSEKINEYIINQISYSGLDEDSIMDAWVDLYGYIILVNISYVFNEELEPEDLTIVANYGLNGVTNKLPTQKPQPVQRTLTNWPMMNTPSNMTISMYSMTIDNSVVQNGTLERKYMIQLKGRKTIMNTHEIQVQQSSVDGKYLEDYNTEVSCPIPKFNFNCPEYTGIKGYDMNLQQAIRNSWFNKKRQSILKVQLSQINLGLQRGTLINLAIFENDVINKKIIAEQTSNIVGNQDTKNDDMHFMEEWSKGTTLIDDNLWVLNIKLSGMYYIDGMEFLFNHDYNEIIQILYLIKKGKTTGYNNKHTPPHVPEIEKRDTLPEDPYTTVPADMNNIYA